MNKFNPFLNGEHISDVHQTSMFVICTSEPNLKTNIVQFYLSSSEVLKELLHCDILLFLIMSYLHLLPMLPSLRDLEAQCFFQKWN